VKKLLGYKRIKNTMKYIGMIHFKGDEFDVTTATTVEEAKQVLSAGFDYVTEKDGIMLFRSQKGSQKYAYKRRIVCISFYKNAIELIDE
jgi:hypothetical protein